MESLEAIQCRAGTSHHRPLLGFKTNAGVDRPLQAVLETPEDSRRSRLFRTHPVPKLEIDLLKELAIRELLRIGQRELLRGLVPRLRRLRVSLDPLARGLGQPLIRHLTQTRRGGFQDAYFLGVQQQSGRQFDPQSLGSRCVPPRIGIRPYLR